MGFQWALDIEKTLSVVAAYLNQNGFLAFSVPVDGNFPEINKMNKIKTPSHELIITLLEKLGFEICNEECITYVESFDDQISVLRSIKNVGAQLVKPTGFKVGLSRSHVKNIFIDPEKNRLTYKIGFYIAKKR